MAKKTVKAEAAKAEVKPSETPAAGKTANTETAYATRLRNNLDVIVSRYNEAVSKKEFELIPQLEAQADETKNKVNEALLNEYIAKVKQAPDVMRAVALHHRVPIVRVMVKPQKDGTVHMSYEDSSKPIDPMVVHQKVDGGIGHDKSWPTMIERVCFNMTRLTAEQLHAADEVTFDKFKMSEAAKALSQLKMFGDDGSIDMSKCISDDLLAVMSAMIGEDEAEVDETAVQYFKKGFTKKSTRASMTIETAPIKNVRILFIDLCHHALTGDRFAVSSKEFRK